MRSATLLLGAGCGVFGGSMYFAQQRHERMVASEQRSAQVRAGAERYDLCVIGGGIVGLAVARQARLLYPNMRICVLEKEHAVASHQSGHNSGVIHAGIYYTPGTVQARLCVRGAELMYQYCAKHNLPCERVGKLIVAAEESERADVDELYRRGVANGVKGLEVLHSAQEIQKLEPNVVGVAALHSPNTGIVDFGCVARHIAKTFEALPYGTIKTGFEVTSVTKLNDKSLMVFGREPGQHGPLKAITANYLIACPGLHASVVGKMLGGPSEPVAMAFRGRYYQVSEKFKDIVKRNVYPTPRNSGIPTGIHFTPTVNVSRGNQMIVGPGAAPAFAREGYSATLVDLSYLWDAIRSPGGWNFLLRSPHTVVDELWKDLSFNKFLGDAKRLVPSLEASMIEPSFCGVMQQCFDQDGVPSANFQFETDDHVLSVRCASSPAATASLAIAEEVLAMARDKLGLKTSH